MPGELEETFINNAWYQAQIDEATTEESRNTGTPGIIIRWTVTEGEMAGKSIMDERWINANSASRHQKEILEVLDYDIATEDLDEIGSKLKGRQATIRVKLEEWPPDSNKIRAKVDRIRKKGDESSMLPPAQRIARIFGRESARDKEWEKDKKF